MNSGPREALTFIRQRLPVYGLLMIASASLIYAVVTAPRVGIDLMFFQTGAREWVDGVFQIGKGVIGVYTPFLLPLFSPIALLSFDTLVLVWIAVNLAATALSLYFVKELWGRHWQFKTRLILAAFFLAFAPFRVTMRNGQISLIVLALLLGALVARRRNRNFWAGSLLGLSLCKYTLTIPFFLYFLWKRDWKVVSTAVLLPLALTELFALRLGLGLFQVIRQYSGLAAEILFSGLPNRTGTTEIRLLFLDLSGGNESFAAIAGLSVSVAALICMLIVFAKKPRWELAHIAVLSLFSLWSVYHRTYDSVFCLVPAALFVDFLVRERFVRFSKFWLAALGLLIVSVPGVLVDRLQLNASVPARNPLFLAGVHIERLLVFGMFWSLLFVIWKAPANEFRDAELVREREDQKESETASTVSTECRNLLTTG
jgi:hypothetical protein